MQRQGIKRQLMSLAASPLRLVAMLECGHRSWLKKRAPKHIEMLAPRAFLIHLERRGPLEVITDAASKVGACAFFYCLLIIPFHFIACSLSKLRRRCFGPLALTKTYAMAASALSYLSLGAVLWVLDSRKNSQTNTAPA